MLDSEQWLSYHHFALVHFGGPIAEDNNELFNELSLSSPSYLDLTIVELTQANKFVK